MNAQTERLSLEAPAGAIEVARDAAAAGVSPRGVAVIAHPHPLFGGTMDNKVVQTLARAFVSGGFAAVRFNFRAWAPRPACMTTARAVRTTCWPWCSTWRPRGRSPWPVFVWRLRHQPAMRWRGCGASSEVVAAVLVGTAASRFTVAPVPPEAHLRTLVVHGEHDETVPLSQVMDWAGRRHCRLRLSRGGHFFHGQLPLLRRPGHAPPAGRGLTRLSFSRIPAAAAGMSPIQLFEVPAHTMKPLPCPHCVPSPVPP